ncbi:MAG: hypothetical protein U0Z44_21160 [Kouleothrix sp.]
MAPTQTCTSCGTSPKADDGSNYAGLRDDQIDELLANARRERDIALRASSYEAFQRRWVDLVPSIMLYQPLLIYTATNQLDGLDLDQRSGPADPRRAGWVLGHAGHFRNVTRWFIRSAREIQGELR